jgi:hypothetical protein
LPNKAGPNFVYLWGVAKPYTAVSRNDTSINLHRFGTPTLCPCFDPYRFGIMYLWPIARHDRSSGMKIAAGENRVGVPLPGFSFFRANPDRPWDVR